MPKTTVFIGLITAAAATTTQTTEDQTNKGHRGVKVVLDTTTVGSASLTLTIEGKDRHSGKYFTLLSGAAVSTDTTNVYTVYPGLTAAANVTVSDVLPETWRVKVTAGNANAATYKVGASLLP